mmetsp:Transcript_31389/g.65030  ORF Transcript_31389/g.65030 Transcript_31389/m.65030 type:complete len:114 (+) Transcript_31389:2-343(+)
MVVAKGSDQIMRFARISGGAIGCPGQHVLADKAAEEGWTCDVCKMQAVPGETLNDCRLCDWDACEGCRRKVDTDAYDVELQEGEGAPSSFQQGVPAAIIGKLSPVTSKLGEQS